jgi:MSHA biogenesis protein MshO
MSTKPRHAPRPVAGFTLIEMVMAILITGIIGAVVASFMRAPVQGYVDSVRRAELTDAADTALRRIVRDLRTSLPNSLRSATAASSLCFEFLPTLAGGRYRIENGTGAGPFDKLDFAVADASFDVLAQSGLPQPAGTQVVVYNLGLSGADAYSGSNRAQVSSSTTSSVTLTAAKLFPYESPTNRFQVTTSTSTVFACVGAGTSAAGDGTGALYRYTQAIAATAMATCPAATPAGAVMLADNVSACNFSYSPAITQRAGLLGMTLRLTRAGESVQLYQEVHVDNAP